MNILRNPFFSGFLSVKNLLGNVGGRSGGVFGKSVVDSGCICTGINDGVNSSPGGLHTSGTRSYGTLRTLLPNTSAFGDLPSTSMTSRPLLSTFNMASNLMGGVIGSSQITPGQVYVPSRGMKYKGKVKRRCKDCFLMWINGMLYNLCKTHPRHKHGLKQPYFSNQRILAHATQCPKRPWGKVGSELLGNRP